MDLRIRLEEIEMALLVFKGFLVIYSLKTPKHNYRSYVNQFARLFENISCDICEVEDLKKSDLSGLSDQHIDLITSSVELRENNIIERMNAFEERIAEVFESFSKKK